MLELTYYYSACVGIKSKDVSILCDPWFSQGVFDGSWYHYPIFSKDPLDIIGQYDYVWISHIHPDHYDPHFLARYLEKYKNSKIIISDFKKNFLFNKMTSDGFLPTVIKELSIGSTSLKTFLNTEDIFNVDSSLVVKRGNSSIVNYNDNAFDAQQLIDIKKYCNNNPTIALIAYTGAGPYPQTYQYNDKTMEQKALEKKYQFFQKYLEIKNFLNPKVSIPFAGKYVLGGNLSHLNNFRGVADAVEVVAIDPTAIVLDDGGVGSINTETLVPTAVRKEMYDQKSMDLYCAKLSSQKMDYELYFKNLPFSKIPFKKLLPKAYYNALKFSQCDYTHYYCFNINNEYSFCCSVNKDNPHFFYTDEHDNEIERISYPKNEISIDYRYLFGLITSVFHWNNAEVGSQFTTKRTPDIYDRKVQSFLNFFCI